MTPSEIQPGMKFGHWTVKKYSHTNKHRIKYFLCECDCGTQRAVRGVALIQGTSTACSKQCNNNIIGQKFGKWTVLSADKSRPRYYWCRCECGTERSVFGSGLTTGRTLSCGCLNNNTAMREKMSGVRASTSLRYQEEVGKHIGSLTILGLNGPYNFSCLCDCGKKFTAAKYSVMSGNTISCGCKRAATYKQNKLNEYSQKIGVEINHLRVDKCYFKNNNFWYDCTCDCGKKVSALATKVISGYVQSCGHLKSKAEEEMEKILIKYDIPYKREYKFPECADKMPLPFDFAVFNKVGELVGVMELNGAQHYIQGGWATEKHVAYVQKHDKIKYNFCLNNKIPLLVIPYQYYNELEKFLTTSNFWNIITENFND